MLLRDHMWFSLRKQEREQTGLFYQSSMLKTTPTKHSLSVSFTKDSRSTDDFFLVAETQDVLGGIRMKK